MYLFFGPKPNCIGTRIYTCLTEGNLEIMHKNNLIMSIRMYNISIFIMIWGALSAQVNFKNETAALKSENPTRSTLPSAFVDINGDRVDDLVILDRGTVLKVYVSTGNNDGLILLDSMSLAIVPLWSLSVGWVEDEEVATVIAAGTDPFVYVVKLYPEGWQLQRLTGGFFAQASNLVDIDVDGDLDYFVCNDNGENRLYLYEEDIFVPKKVIDFSGISSQFLEGNYGSIWTDINFDNMPDLYVSKCRAGVNDSTDLRRVNNFYISQPDGSYIDEASARGVADGRQSWVSTFFDADNDGDQDLYIVNHYDEHRLMINEGEGYFIESHFVFGVEDPVIQVLAVDMDNDTWVDIVCSGVGGAFWFQNMEGKGWQRRHNFIGFSDVRSLTYGDLNEDGFIDFYAHLNNLLNEVGVKDDQIWINQGNENNWLTVSLHGQSDNQTGVGSIITLYGSWGKQLRQIHAGESYGITNSQNAYFGLGEARFVDSLIIRWPNGTIDRHYGILASQHVHAYQGGCTSIRSQVYKEPL